MPVSHSDDENVGAEPCYKGEHPQQWAKHMQALNNLHTSVLPCVLEKGPTGNWKGVHQAYPEKEGFNPEELRPGKEAMDFVTSEYAKFDHSKATRDEKSALDVYRTTHHFMLVMTDREYARDAYNKLDPAIENLQTKEYNNSVLVMKIKCLRATGERKVELENELLERYQAYEDFKDKYIKALEEFKEMSSEVAARERVAFNEKFNKNAYINFHILGVIILLFLIGCIAAKGDQFFKRWCRFNNSLGDLDNKVVVTFPPVKVVTYLVCLSWFLFVLRGDLMSSFSFITGILIALFTINRLVSKKIVIRT